VWARIRAECERGAAAEPALASFLHATVLVHPTLAASVAAVLANKLASRTLLATQLAALFQDAYSAEPDILEALVADVQAVHDRDPACEELAQAVLYFKGFQAVQAHRVGHWLWNAGRRTLAVALQSRVSEVLHVDIHPAARLGRGLLVDHATGVVIGETAVVGDAVSLLHHVTLGGSGTGRGVRHPRIGDGVLLGAGVCVLGPVTVGAGSKVGAGSVVVTDLPARCVAVGVPARILRTDVAALPAGDMNLVDDFIEDYQI
jgi:serine O-acetyltransferase